MSNQVKSPDGQKIVANKDFRAVDLMQSDPKTL